MSAPAGLLCAHVDSPWCYGALVVLLDLVVRFVVVWLASFERKIRLGSWDFWPRFFGLQSPTNAAQSPINAKPGEGGDYLAPAVLGLIELASYPVLIVASEWSIIGAWIGFKTIAQYRIWGEHRSTFNRFLVGNALVVVLAFLFLRQYVNVSCRN